MPVKQSYPYTVHSQIVDFRKKLTLSSLVRVLLTVADQHAEENGFGFRRLQGLNCTWVLTKLVMEINYFPMLDDQIYVETWVEEVARLGTTRHFSVRNSYGEVVAYACTLWIVIDQTTRRNKDLSTLVDGVATFGTGETVPVGKPVRLQALKLAEEFNSLRVRYSDIDFNGHVSTERYVRWIGDCFTPERYASSDIKRFEINFMNEVLYDDHVRVMGIQAFKNDFRFDLMRGDFPACRARVVF